MPSRLTCRWLYDFFPAFVDEHGVLLSEDYAFSKHWRALGGQIWADPDVQLAHIGRLVRVGALRQGMKRMPEPAAA